MVRVGLFVLIILILLSSCNSSPRYIEPVELKKWQEEKRDFILIDVRGPEPFQEEHIEGAVPLDDIHLKSGKSIVFYCWSTGTSVEVAKSLRGYNIYILNGGIYEWKLKGYPLSKKGDSIP